MMRVDLYHAKDLILKNMVGAFAHDSLRWMGIEHTDVVDVMWKIFFLLSVTGMRRSLAFRITFVPECLHSKIVLNWPLLPT